jgi:hypothetical protein
MYKNTKISLFNISFLILLFVPTFGLEFGGILINIGSFFLSVTYILINKNKQTNILRLNFVTFIFMLLSLLIIISLIKDIYNGSVNFGSFFSALRPVFIFSTIYASYIFWERKNNLLLTWNSFLDIVFVCLFFCSSFEFIFPTSGKIFELLYGARSSEYSGPLGTSYYIGYLFFLFYLHFLFKLKDKYSFKTLIKLLVTLIMIFLCDSKPPLVLGVFMVPFLFFPRSNLKMSTILYFAFTIILFSVVKVDALVEMLLGFNIDSYNVKSLIRILDNAEGSGTFSIRQEQAEMAISGSLSNFGFGLGLGRGILLESWLSYYGYRYGVIGLILYFILWIYLAVKSYLIGIKKNSCNKNWYVIFYLGFWFLFQPVLLMSGGMNESGITGIFSSIIIGLTIVLIKKQNLYSSKNL